MMVGLLVLIAGVLLNGVLAEDMTEYNDCMKACDEKFEGNPEDDQYEVCKDDCNEAEKDRCVAKHSDNKEEQSNCWKAGEKRCLDRCDDDADGDGCPLLCESLFTEED